MRTNLIDGEIGNGYQGLANAIIIQAVKDHHKALNILQRRPYDREQKAVKKEIREFFQSEWFSILTRANGNRLLKEIEEEFNATHHKKA